MLLVSFAGFLRFSEVAKLTIGDVHFFRTHMSIFIGSSKTDVYRNGHVLLISRIHSPICPVQTLCLYTKRATLTHSYDNYLFRAVTWWKHAGEYTLRFTNKPISYTATRTDVLDLIAKIGLNPRDY